MVAGERLTQRLDDGDTASHRRFEIEKRPLVFGNRRQFDAVLGQQRLVGCHHMETTGECRTHRIFRLTGSAADQFDEDVDIGFACHLLGRVEPGNTLEIDAAVARTVARAHRNNLNRASAGNRKFVASLLEDAHERSADSAEPRYADSQ
ncbi:hypothetical protein D3C86_1145320 [compost metagenome]